MRLSRSPALQQLVGSVVALRPRFQAAVARARNEAQGRDSDTGLPDQQAALEHEDHEHVRCMVRLFLNVSEAFAKLVASGTRQVRISLCKPTGASVYATMHKHCFSLGAPVTQTRVLNINYTKLNGKLCRC